MALIQEFHIGQMREVVKFETSTAISDDAGGEDENFQTWVDLLTTRGSVNKTSGSRGLQAGEVSLLSSYKITVRFQQALANALSSSDSVRIVYNNRFLIITSYELKDEKTRYMIFNCNEKGR